MQHFGDFADEFDLVLRDLHPQVERADQQRAHVLAGDLMKDGSSAPLVRNEHHCVYAPIQRLAPEPCSRTAR